MEGCQQWGAKPPKGPVGAPASVHTGGACGHTLRQAGRARVPREGEGEEGRRLVKRGGEATGDREERTTEETVPRKGTQVPGLAEEDG